MNTKVRYTGPGWYAPRISGNHGNDFLDYECVLPLENIFKPGVTLDEARENASRNAYSEGRGTPVFVGFPPDAKRLESGQEFHDRSFNKNFWRVKESWEK